MLLLNTFELSNKFNKIQLKKLNLCIFRIEKLDKTKGFQMY